MIPQKNIHDSFAQFFETPTRDSFKELLRENFGEADQFDFKAEWPDFPKVAKHVLAIANSGGGTLIVGVAENEDGTLNHQGLNEITDKVDVGKKLKQYVPDGVRWEVLNFSFDPESEYTQIRGRKFQVLTVESDESSIPHLSKRSGKDIRDNCIYVRRATESTEANHDEIQRLLSRRTQATSQEIQKVKYDLAQLRALYQELEQLRMYSSFGVSKQFGYPSRSYEYEEFLQECIGTKKNAIRDRIKS